ncbi:type II toxin-antitoxin system VapC family toxin [Ornithinimicrobium faecis]|uniref:Type II toxin-antitoxin system VapC family toxin n=1 Tax=Ornithinimicrobium faecis TaxID=2934158 RepID=A0ABY4YR92_9MICO|nr:MULTISPECIES: type II toxin-antitoxin system VapC family toxin [unclassified Ornithinimicrobium]USQ79261.1 type II toxin-antitoxin system VapC family toxin [Ornithinimicrobium sp. HY1793]
MTSVFVDTSVFLLAQGSPHPLREGARQFLSRCHEAGVSIHVSVEALQEFTFHRMRARPRQQVLAEAATLRRGVVVHAFDELVLDAMLALLEGSELRGRDAVHAATATVAGFDRLVTADRDFVAVPGLTAVRPEDWRL